MYFFGSLSLTDSFENSLKSENTHKIAQNCVAYRGLQCPKIVCGGGIRGSRRENEGNVVGIDAPGPVTRSTGDT